MRAFQSASAITQDSTIEPQPDPQHLVIFFCEKISARVMGGIRARVRERERERERDVLVIMEEWIIRKALTRLDHAR